MRRDEEILNRRAKRVAKSRKKGNIGRKRGVPPYDK